jgi:dienelactone hydrolase
MNSYCFGAPYVCRELAEGGNCAAGAFAHPAFLKESHFRSLTSSYHTCADDQILPPDIFAEPLFLSCSQIDHTFPADSRNHAIDILHSSHKTYHLQLFSGVEHGFALRGNPDNPYECMNNTLEMFQNLANRSPGWVKEQSLQGIIDWLNFWLEQ